MTITTNLVRKFRFGVTVLDDPDPKMTPEQVVDAYSSNFPFLKNATIADPVVEGAHLVFNIEKPRIQTKGASAVERAADAAADSVRHWAQQTAVPTGRIELWNALYPLVQEVVNRNPAPITESLLIPLA